MQLLVFVTDDGGPEGSGPLLFVDHQRRTTLPPHPRSLEWRYFAAIDMEDDLFVLHRSAALPALRADGFYISNLPFT
jgi:hypothetical protein